MMPRPSRAIVRLLGSILSVTFSAAAATPQNWLSSDWTYRVPFAVAPGQVTGSGALSDFSLLLQLGGASTPSLFALAKSDGSDLVLTASDGMTAIPYELVSYDAGAQTAELWFRSGLDPNGSNAFYLYYGNPDTTISHASSVAWGAEHLGVYHFSDDPSLGTLTDSGPGGNHGVAGLESTFDSSDRVTGSVGSGWSFDGDSDWVYNTTMASTNGSYTISAWFANSPNRIDTAMAFQTLDGYWDISFQRTSLDFNSALSTSTGEMYWLPDITDTLLHHYVWTMDAAADTACFYLDGVQRGVKVHWSPMPGGNAYEGEAIGGRVGIGGPIYFAPQELIDGVLDEYRISEGTRSADWIATEFRNQSAPTTFFAFAAQESLGNDVTDVSPIGSRTSLRLAAWPNPFRGVAQIEVNSGAADLRVRVYDVAGRVVRELSGMGAYDEVRRFRWDGRDANGNSVGNGIYYVRAQDATGSVGLKLLMRP